MGSLPEAKVRSGGTDQQFAAFKTKEAVIGLSLLMVLMFFVWIMSDHSYTFISVNRWYFSFVLAKTLWVVFVVGLDRFDGSEVEKNNLAAPATNKKANNQSLFFAMDTIYDVPQ